MKKLICSITVAAALLAAQMGTAAPTQVLLETWENAPEAAYDATATSISGSDVPWALVTFTQTGTAIVTKTGALAPLNRALDVPNDSTNNANTTRLTYTLPTPIDANTKKVILSCDFAVDIVNGDGQPSVVLACGGYSFTTKRNDLALAVSPNDNRLTLNVTGLAAGVTVLPGATDVKTPTLDTIYTTTAVFEKLSSTQTKITTSVTSSAHNLLSQNDVIVDAALSGADASLSAVTVTLQRRFRSVCDNIKIQTEDIVSSVGQWQEY